MLRELITIFTSNNPLSELGKNFTRMLQLTRDMTSRAGIILFENQSSPEERTRIYEEDVEVNKLERAIRKQVVSHLSVAQNRLDVPYCVLLISLVKDVERLGDYAKNVSEIIDIHPPALPDDDNVRELGEIRQGVESAFAVAADIFNETDLERAVEFIRKGRDAAHRADALVQKLARGDYDASTTTALVLATRFYKRLMSHVTNILTSVVMPLHKVDYYDEDEIPEEFK